MAKEAVKFTEGSVMRHILVMTGASTIALLAIFLVDFVDMFFLSLLGQEELAASIGFATTVLFLLTAVCLGCQVGAGAIIARAEGGDDRATSVRYFAHILVFSVLITGLIAAVFFVFSHEILVALGAKGQTLVYAEQYLRIVVPATPLLAIGMCSAVSLRALGDAKRSMYTLIAAALVNLVLDPIFIFGLGLGVEGAALATAISRVAMVAVGLGFVFRRYGFTWRQQPQCYRADLRMWGAIAFPAMLTSVSTPIGSMIVMRAIADYGVEAVAAVAIVSRIMPVANAALFSLSGAIGPIIGQNLGAGLFDRVNETLVATLKFTVVYIICIWLSLILLTDWLIYMFGATGLTAELLHFYTHVLSIGFIFNAMLFIANAAFNNLGKATYATAFNFSRSIFGILPAVILLAPIYGAKGVMVAEVVGQSVFGIVAYMLVFRVVRQLEHRHRQAEALLDAP